MKKEMVKQPTRAARSIWLAAILLFFFPVFVSAPASGGTEDPQQSFDWKSACKGVEKVQFPPKDRPGPEEAKALENCSSMDLYYGFDKPADPVKARKCAYLEMDKGDELVFGGSPILMMIYANGKGVVRNPDLAIKLACNITGAPAEVEGRIEHLARLKRTKWTGDNFSLCDDITSGFMEGHCASLEGRFAGAKRKKRLSVLTVKWTEKDRNAFEVLDHFLENFIKSRVDNEVDLSGTGRGAFMAEEESALREDFLSDLERLEHGEFPKFPREQFAKTDGELNSVYGKIQKTKDATLWGTVTKEGIKQTQRAWLKYRDAWVVFAQHKYPQIGADKWKIWLTRKRIKMLNEFSEDSE